MWTSNILYHKDTNANTPYTYQNRIDLNDNISISIPEYQIPLKNLTNHKTYLTILNW